MSGMVIPAGDRGVSLDSLVLAAFAGTGAGRRAGPCPVCGGAMWPGQPDEGRRRLRCVECLSELSEEADAGEQLRLVS